MDQDPRPEELSVLHTNVCSGGNGTHDPVASAQNSHQLKAQLLLRW